MFPRFLIWHYSKAIADYFGIWNNYLAFFWNNLSVGRFLRTLFSPWKRDVSRMGLRGFHPLLSLQAGLENFLTRILGAILKIGLIFLALILEALTVILGIFILAAWVISPAILLVSIYSIISALARADYLILVFYSVFFLLSLFLLAVSFSSFRRQHKNYYEMDLAEMSDFPWFERVINRLGSEKSQFDFSLLDDLKKFNKSLEKLEIKYEEFEEILRFEIESQLMRENKKRFWSKENMNSHVPIGRYWAYAYTVNLDRYSTDLSSYDPTDYKEAKVFGLENALNELLLILTKNSQSNAIIIGEPGVGKNSILHSLARLVRTNKIVGPLANKRVLEINLKEALSNCAGPDDVDKLLNLLFSEAAYSGNIVLFIKDIHQFTKANPTDPREDISPILSEFLTYPSFQIIGTTTASQFHSNIEKKENIMKYCDKVLIPEMSEQNTLKVLLDKLKEAERTRVIVTYPALKEIVKLSDRYISDSPFPEKALDLLEEVLLFWSNNPSGIFITAQDVAKALSSKLGIALGEVTQDESAKLLDLEKILHKRVIGQNLAISQIAEAMRRARVGMADKNKPLGSFLFLGPTGVGKTESTKALAEAYFGDENRMIRLDMSEYQREESIDRIIGAQASGREGYLVSKVKESPHALLLLDEIEKAHPDILNLFLQVLDEGYLTDTFGKKISFRNLIIIATSNACADLIRVSVGKGLDSKAIKDKVVNQAIKEGIFKPEFLNRFEGVIFFEPLNEESARTITQLLLDKYAKKLKDEKNIEVVFSPDLASTIVEKSYDPLFGARAISRFIEDRIGDKIVKKIIAKEIAKGQTLSFGSAELSS